MKRYMWCGWGRRLLGVVLAGLLVLRGDLWAGSAAASDQPATRPATHGAALIQPAQPLTIPFSARSLATYQTTTHEAGVGWLQTSRSWAAYALSFVGCGHCGTYLDGLRLVNLLDTRHVAIRTTLWDDRTGFPWAIGSVVFGGPYLVWTQPGHTAPPGSDYTPGDFDCTVCAYNVDTGQGGPAAALESLQTFGPQGQTNLQLLDADQFGLVLAVVHGATDRLWTVNLGTGEQKQVAAGAPGLHVKEGILFESGVAWLEGSDLYAVEPNAPRHQVAGDVTALPSSHGTFLLWHARDGVYIDAQPQPKRVAPANADFAASDSPPGIGAALAWADSHGPNAGTLTVVSLDPANPNPPPLLGQSLPTALRAVRLDYDHLVYIADTPAGNGPPIEDVELVWLMLPVPAFGQVWARADAPVAAGTAPRSWLWGPAPRYAGYEANQGPIGTHQVLYYDKARMEVNNPYANPGSPGYVTNGLLAVEMIGGAFQVGISATITASVPCTIPVVGDPRQDNPLTPDYAALAGVASLHGDHQAPNRIGQPVDGALDVHGIVSTDAAHAGLARYAAFVPQTGHNIPDLFWRYLQAMPATYGFDWAFVVGYPITEGYWTQMRVGGKDYPVLIQAFQRRVLTYVPAFPAPWQIQQGNVGQHYLEWRYTLNR